MQQGSVAPRRLLRREMGGHVWLVGGRGGGYGTATKEGGPQQRKYDSQARHQDA